MMYIHSNDETVNDIWRARCASKCAQHECNGDKSICVRKKSNSFCNFAIHKQVLTSIISEVWRHWKIGTCETRQA